MTSACEFRAFLTRLQACESFVVPTPTSIFSRRSLMHNANDDVSTIGRTCSTHSLVFYTRATGSLSFTLVAHGRCSRTTLRFTHVLTIARLEVELGRVETMMGDG